MKQQNEKSPENAAEEVADATLQNILQKNTKAVTTDEGRRLTHSISSDEYVRKKVCRHVQDSGRYR